MALVSIDDDLPTVGELTNEELFAEAAVAGQPKDRNRTITMRELMMKKKSISQMLRW